MLLGRGQDEDRIRRGFFQGFQEGVKSRRAEHVYFIDDIHFIFACLGGESYLFHQGPDIVNGIIAGGIELMNIQRDAFVKRDAGMAFVTGFSVRLRVFAIDGFGQYPGAGGFTDTPGTAEKKGMRKLVIADRILQGGGDV